MAATITVATSYTTSRGTITVREVIVAGDNDAPGLAAAKRAVARFRSEGRRVQLAIPDKAGADFNDVLRDRFSYG